ncbi:MAG TPA: DUF2273 domain-containing protein [Bacillota bacterium]|jgi:uncharacterized membrane protein|nr:DUF2273 domain-containing protein [Fastidiosipila sp.]HPX92947.1 DUF2273 domain-containing protein [Bacillota bacterium]HQB80761.1 DUF2273 domain-containing protein [Bacillota bacterium]
MHTNDPSGKPDRGGRPPLSSGIIGALIMFAVALLWILFGFWRLLFIFLLTLAGYYVGFRYFRDRDAIRKLIDRILPPGMFR